MSAENYGENYVAEGNNEAKKGTKKIQDAHEAIRPTDISRTPVLVKESLSRDQFRLYQLIWKRFTASRMANAVYETTQVKIQAGEYHFHVSASRLSFDGFMSVYVDDSAEKGREQCTLERHRYRYDQLNLKEFRSRNSILPSRRLIIQRPPW